MSRLSINARLPLPTLFPLSIRHPLSIRRPVLLLAATTLVSRGRTRRSQGSVRPISEIYVASVFSWRKPVIRLVAHLSNDDPYR